MAKNKMLKLLNPVLALLIVTQALSGLLRFQLPPDVFEVVHKGGGIVLVAGVGLHLLLNFSWIRSTYWRSSTSHLVR